MSTSSSSPPPSPPQPSVAAAVDGGGSGVGGAVIPRPNSASSLRSVSPELKQQAQQKQQPMCSISSGAQVLVRTSSGKILHQIHHQEQVQGASQRSPGNKSSTGGLLESIKESPQSQQQQVEQKLLSRQANVEELPTVRVGENNKNMDSSTATERKRKQRPAPLQIPSSYSSSSLSTGGGSVPDFSKITSHINPVRLTGSVRGLTIVSPMTPAIPGSASSGPAGSGGGGVNMPEFNLTYVNVRTRQNRIVQLPRLIASPFPTSANFSSAASNAFFTSE